jgi:hypothetical protein
MGSGNSDNRRPGCVLYDDAPAKCGKNRPLQPIRENKKTTRPSRRLGLHAAVAASLEKTSIPLKWTDEFKPGLRIRAVQHREHYGTFVLKRLLKAESMFDMLIEA